MSRDKSTDAWPEEWFHNRVCASRQNDSRRALRNSLDSVRTQCWVKEEVAEHEAELDTVYCTPQATQQEARPVGDTYRGP